MTSLELSVNSSSATDESLLKSILEGSTHGVLLVNKDGEIVFANSTVAEIFEYDRDELLGRTVEALVPEPTRHDHGKMREDYQEEPTARPMGEGRDLHGVTSTGEKVPVEIGLNPIEYQGERMVIADIAEISERKKLERELEESKRKLEEQLETKSEQLKQLTENIDAVFWMDDVREENEQLYVSPKYEEIWGRPREDFEEDTSAFLKGVLPEDRTRVETALDTMEAGGYDIEYRIETPDGEVKWIHDRAFPIKDEQGNVVKVAGIAEDISERKEIEFALRDALEEKETLLQEVHHRVKNNLQIISSILHLGMRNTSSPDAKKALNESRFRIHAIAKVHQVLYEHDDLRDINLSGYVEELVGEIKNVVRSDSGRVDVEYDLDRTIQVEIQQAIPCGLALNELVTNAFKYGLDSSEDRARVQVTLERTSEDAVKLEVRDNGPGLPVDFDPEDSSGLGLRLVTNLVENQLKGQVTFENDSGVKTTLRFPLEGSGKAERDLSSPSFVGPD